MDFGISSKSFRHDIKVFHKVGDFIKFLHFLDWQFVANACKLREQGAKTVFYMTWADKSRPRTQKVIADAYSRIAAELGAYLAACVSFSVFFNASPEGLPVMLLIEGKIRLDLAEDCVGFLQKIAYETVSSAEVGMRKSE